MADILEVEARLKDFISANLDTITKKIDSTGVAAERAGKKYNSFGAVIEGTVKAFAGMYVVNQVTGMMLKFAEAGDKQAVAQAELANALGYTSTALQDQATALQQVTRYGDEETLAAQARMAAFIKDEEMIKRLIPLVQDFAAAKKMDLASASDLVTKSIASQTSMLSRYGIAVEGDGKTVERFNSVVKGLEETFSGTAKTIGEAGIGPFKIMQNNFGDMAETVGTILTPAINSMAESLNESIGIWNKWLTALQKGKDNSKDITDGLIEQAVATGDVSAIQSKLLEMDKYRLEVGNAMIKEGKTLSYWNSINNESLKEEKKLREAMNKIKAGEIGPGAKKFSSDVDPDVAEKAAEKARKEKERADKEWERVQQTESNAYMSKLKAQEEFQNSSLLALEVYNTDRLSQMDEFAQLSIKAMPSEFDQERALLAIDIEEKKNAIFAFETFTINSKEQASKMRIQLSEYEASAMKGIREKEVKEIQKNNEKRLEQETEFRDGKLQVATSLLSSMRGIMDATAKDNRAVFNVMKAAAIAEATINGFMASSNAFRSGSKKNIWYGVAQAIAAGAVATAQVVGIAAQKYAVGTSGAQSGLALVGEMGPELVDLPQGTRVRSALSTRNIINNSSNVNNNTSKSNVMYVNVKDETTGKKLIGMLRGGELDSFIVDLRKRGNF